MDLLMVDWEDSCSPHGWVNVEDLDARPVLVRSVGWFVGETDRVLMLAAHLARQVEDGRTTQMDGVMIIPKATITRREVLNEKEQDAEGPTEV